MKKRLAVQLRTGMIALLAPGLVVASACGRDDEQRRTPGSSETRAVDATLLEEDENGRPVWKLHASSIIQSQPGIDGETMTLEMHDYDGGGERTSTATARRGTVRQQADSTVVTLSGGFTLDSADGWNATGDSVIWNGEVLRTADPVRISRGDAWLHGSAGAVIDPNRNRFRIFNVEGKIGTLSP